MNLMPADLNPSALKGDKLYSVYSFRHDSKAHAARQGAAIRSAAPVGDRSLAAADLVSARWDPETKRPGGHPTLTGLC
jgi:hypothetical protein